MPRKTLLGPADAFMAGSWTSSDQETPKNDGNDGVVDADDAAGLPPPDEVQVFSKNSIRKAEPARNLKILGLMKLDSYD